NVDRQSHLYAGVTGNWAHSGRSGTWPGGDDVNYVRIYVPEGAKLLDSVNFDNNVVDSFASGDKQVFGGFVTVPYGSAKSITIKYQLPEKLGIFESNGNYELLWQKQSRISEEPLKVTFNAPPFLKTENISGNGRIENESVVWDGALATDQSFRMNIQHK